ncbi:MAG TPA: DUF1192 family protein [Novosphingobium sp.]
MDEDLPLRSGAALRHGAAGQLAGESLDSYSQDELAARIQLLHDEIARVTAHRDRAAAHRAAAEAFFRPGGSGSSGRASGT